MTQPAAAAPTGGALPPLLSGSVYTVLLIAGAVILFVFFVSAAVHLFLRFLSHRRSSPPAATSPRLFLLLRSPSSSSSYSSSSANSLRPPPPPIDVLPLVTLASSAATVPRLALECAVCLSRFRPDDELRLLPACRHAFHSACIETWISSSLSCPLCRAPIFHEPLTSNLPRADSSGSFRVEIGSVSRRSAVEGPGAPAAPQRTSSLSFSLGSSFEYVVEEDVEAVITALADQVRRQRRQGKDLRCPAPAAPPGDEVAESAGRVGDSKNWLRGYLDRLASSASSSFSSLRFSARSSRRMAAASPVAAAAAVAGGGVGWDPEGSSRWRGEAEETVSTYYNAIYRWLSGA